MRLVMQPSLLLAAAFLSTVVKDCHAMYCASEYKDWEGCLIDDAGTQGAQDCMGCLDLSDSGLYFMDTCDEITEHHCWWRGACSVSCESDTCDALYQTYLACFWGSDCFTGCSGERPTSTDTPCADEEAAAGQCVEATGDGADACVSCLQDYVPDSDGRDCEQSELYTCGATQACPECGNCQNELVAMVNCQNKLLCDPFTCPDGEPSEQPAMSPGEPAPSPVQPAPPSSEEPTRPFSDEPTTSPQDDPTPSPQEDPTPSPQENPTPSPQEEPTLSPQEEPTPSPHEDPTPSPQEEPTPSPQEDPTPSPQEDPTSPPQSEPTATGGGDDETDGEECEALNTDLHGCFSDHLTFSDAIQCSACVTAAFAEEVDDNAQADDVGSSRSAAAAALRTSLSSSSSSRTSSSSCNVHVRPMVGLTISECGCGDCTDEYVDHLFCIHGPTWLGACPPQDDEADGSSSTSRSRSDAPPSSVPTSLPPPPNRFLLLLLASRKSKEMTNTAASTAEPPPSSGGGHTSSPRPSGLAGVACAVAASAIPALLLLQLA